MADVEDTQEAVNAVTELRRTVEHTVANIAVLDEKTLGLHRSGALKKNLIFAGLSPWLQR